MVSGSVIIFDEMKEFESHIDEAEAEGDLETLVLSEEEEELFVDLECESQSQGDKLVVTGTRVCAGTTIDTNTENTDSDIGGTSASSSTKLHCSKCSRPYKRAVFLAKHEERCDGRKIRKESTISIQTSGTVSYEHSILYY